MPDSADSLGQAAIGVMLQSVDPSEALDTLCDAIDQIDPWHPVPTGIFQLCAAVAIVSPDTLTSQVAKSIAAAIDRANVETVSQPGLDELFKLLNLLIPTPAAKAMPDLLAPLCTDAATHPRWSTRALLLLSELDKWQPDTVSLEAVVDIVASASHEVTSGVTGLLEDQMLRSPSSVLPEHLTRIMKDENAVVRYRYLINALAIHPRTEDSVRALCLEWADQLFPLCRLWSALGGSNGLNVLVIQNIADGQGDEIVRLNGLMQSFLDSHEETQIMLISDRCYLWGHPRLKAISFDDWTDLDSGLAHEFDVVIEFYETQVTFLNHDPRLHDMIEQLRADSTFLLDVQASKGWNRFTLDSVRIKGQEWSPALALNQPRVASVYDPVQRLLAELGLPLRLGTSQHEETPVLWNEPVREEMPHWNHLLSEAPDDRRVALLNPFGGSSELKGFTVDMLEDLGEIVTQLVAAGYSVVLCSGSEPWSSRHVVSQAVALLPPDIVSHCRVAPAPRDDASRTNWMRQMLECLHQADLIVTVEGWMVHAANALGKPFNVLMVSASEGAQWMPWGRNAAQCYRLFARDHRALSPPLPEQPRKQAWIDLLSRMDSTAWLEVLEPVLASRDTDVRLAAVRAVGRIHPDRGLASLLSLLQDSSCVVRAEAATIVMNVRSSCSTEDKVPDADELIAYQLIGAYQPNRNAICDLGESAGPALKAALYDDDPTVRRIAAACLEEIVRRQEVSNQSEAPRKRPLVSAAFDRVRTTRLTG